MANEELKPCPFCGGTADIQYAMGSTLVVRVKCKACGASTRNIETSSEKRAKNKAVALWNKRRADSE